ncbi:mucosa-associated lymphoid tissue lymphoma translocation protein 1-like isoform X3 [Columba livia]|uniref:mucosa-associated lymphoid tissue lymphoma translocation protein 1-like isoform X3 n=1 Tax=Columba livia TaxID=8932 RepID=UPI0031BA16DE
MTPVGRGRGTARGGGQDTREQGRHGQPRCPGERLSRAVPGCAVPGCTGPCRAVPGRAGLCCPGLYRAVHGCPGPRGSPGVPQRRPAGLSAAAGRAARGRRRVRAGGAQRGPGPASRSPEPGLPRPAGRPSPPPRPPCPPAAAPGERPRRPAPSRPRAPGAAFPPAAGAAAAAPGEEPPRAPPAAAGAGEEPPEKRCRKSHCRQIPGATDPDLPITAQQTQLYTCRVNDLHRNAVFSDWVKVEVHQCVARGLPTQRWRGEPLVVLNPTEQRVEVGKPLQLQCAAMGVPAPAYQWYRNGNPLEHQRKKKLWIAHAKVSDSGTYLCCASNRHGEHWTHAVDVHIGTCHPEKFFATGKVALLVGNNGYQHHPNLLAPLRDVFELRLLLEQLGFQVVSLLDLNKAEMAAAVSRFLQLLGKGVYAIFYYAGHGYEHSGRNYMVPVDAPQPYTPANCISVQRILQKMQQQHTALNLILLDTCRKWYNPECPLSQVQALEPWGNTVYGYATCEDAEAYELQDGEFSSGIFMKYLKKHILQEKKVTHMLEDVLEDIGRDPLVTGKQVMEIKHTLKEARSLTDPICPSGAAAEQWGRSHDPLSRTLTFPCGAQVELCFHRLFSNMMYVCAKLQPPPAHVADARVLLCRPTEVDDAAVLEESRPEPAESLLASVYKREELDCVFQLCGLQRIQTHWGCTRPACPDH